MTTNAQLDISVLSAPLAAIDRRSLSQAWYSALHLAREAAPPKRAAAPRAHVKAAGAPAHAPASAATRKAAAAPPSWKAGHRAAARGGAGIERRAPRLSLARRIERALFERASSASHATFGVGEGSSRVVVALHASGDRVRLIALCSPSMRRAVAQALDQARFALAARGIALDAGFFEGAARCS